MPIRKTPLVNGEVYHVFNRGVNFQPIFNNKRDYLRAIEVMKFYLPIDPPVRYSRFLLLPRDERELIQKKVKKQPKRVDIICFCLMPNHFHLLLKQNEDHGISSFVRNLQISYTRFFNIKRERIGPLLQGQFKAVRVENEKQLLHVSRYIHLNPYSSFVIKDTKELENYQWSSYPEYLGIQSKEICQKGLIFSIIKTGERYKEFVLNQADYQRRLEEIKHLTFE